MADDTGDFSIDPFVVTDGPSAGAGGASSGVDLYGLDQIINDASSQAMSWYTLFNPPPPSPPTPQQQVQYAQAQAAIATAQAHPALTALTSTVGGTSSLMPVLLIGGLVLAAFLFLRK